MTRCRGSTGVTGLSLVSLVHAVNIHVPQTRVAASTHCIIFFIVLILFRSTSCSIIIGITTLDKQLTVMQHFSYLVRFIGSVGSYRIY